MKRTSSIESIEKVAPLTRETLAAMSPHKEALTHSPVAVSEDSRSVVSSSNLSVSSGALSTGFSQKGSRNVVLADAKLIEASLRQRDEEERLRVAKAMLYDAYQKALRGD